MICMETEGITKAMFIRQNRIFNPENNTYNVTIIGAGSTGSFVAFTLAKMGFNKIKVIDFDKVEEHNIPNQYFRIKDIGRKKTEALKEIIKEFSNIDIEIIDENISPKSGLGGFDLNTIIVNCVDNMETRRNVFNILEGFPIKIIDTRFGGEGYSIHLCNCDDENSLEEYKRSLEGEIKETECGMKAVIYTINSLASEVCNYVKRISNDERNPSLLRREMKTYKFIERKG